MNKKTAKQEWAATTTATVAANQLVHNCRWVKTASPSTFPETPFEEIVDKGIAAWYSSTARAAAINVRQCVITDGSDDFGIILF